MANSVPAIVFVFIIFSTIGIIQAFEYLRPLPDITFSTRGIYSFSEMQDALHQQRHTFPQNPWDNYWSNSGSLNLKRKRRSTTHSDHLHTRKGKCFFGVGGGGSSTFAFQPTDLPDRPEYDHDPRFANVPMPYNILRSASLQNAVQQSPSKTTGPFPFAYRIFGQN